jgi:hypothetical protein
LKIAFFQLHSIEIRIRGGNIGLFSWRLKKQHRLASLKQQKRTKDLASVELQSLNYNRTKALKKIKETSKQGRGQNSLCLDLELW